MHPSVERISRYLGLPESEPSRVPWERTRAEIGFEFPTDYRDFIDRYGSVDINGELLVWAPTLSPSQPGAPGGFPGFVWNTMHEGGIGDYLASAYEEGNFSECPYPVYPEPGGLLIWANNFNADHCFWLTEGGDPNRWSVAVWYRQLAEWDRFDGGMVDFLFSVVTGDYELANELAPRSPGTALYAQKGGWT